MDSSEPYKSYEFKFEEDFYIKNIEIPAEDNYYLTLKAVTPDKEFLSYKSYLINNDNNDEESSNNSDIFWIILIVCIGVILLIILFICIRSCCIKNRIKNDQIDDIQKMAIPLSNESELGDN